MQVKKTIIPWNKGLTKETDERVMKQAKKLSAIKQEIPLEPIFEDGNEFDEEY